MWLATGRAGKGEVDPSLASLPVPASIQTLHQETSWSRCLPRWERAGTVRSSQSPGSLRRGHDEALSWWLRLGPLFEAIPYRGCKTWGPFRPGAAGGKHSAGGHARHLRAADMGSALRAPLDLLPLLQ